MAIKKRPVSPRQKMINLMYVVLMAMLALNVSTEVLNGFSIVEESLKRTTQNASLENQVIYDDFAVQMKKNPQKVKQWYDKSQKVKQMSDDLYNLADELKLAIVQEADGSDGDVQNIRNKEDLEAANQVMLSPNRGRGKELYNAIINYRTQMLSMVTGYHQKKMIASNLSTDIPANAQTMGKNWQEYMFESMPAAAAVTLLSKLQSDVRYAEGEVLHTLVSNIDVKVEREAYTRVYLTYLLTDGRGHLQLPFGHGPQRVLDHTEVITHTVLAGNDGLVLGILDIDSVDVGDKFLLIERELHQILQQLAHLGGIFGHILLLGIHLRLSNCLAEAFEVIGSLLLHLRSILVPALLQVLLCILLMLLHLLFKFGGNHEVGSRV